MADALSAGLDQLKLTTIDEIEVINITKPAAKDFIADGNLMVIMRGVPGCGKSTIVKHLMGVFDTNCVCSADQYFMKGGTYNYDRSKIKDAHQYCHDKASLFCEQGHSVVIIDNTCIVAWETRKYIEIANKTGYIVIMITPNGHFTTPTEVLARRNKHEVPADIIERKRRDFSIMRPAYYGWFVSKRSTLQLYKVRDEALSKIKQHGCLSVSHSENKPVAHMTSVYGGQMDPLRVDELTAKFRGHFGDIDTLNITHIVVTPRTVSARVKLGRLARSVYDNDGGKDDFNAGYHANPGYGKLPRGNAAHVTLGTAAGVKNSQARLDMILSHLCEVNDEPSRIYDNGRIVYYPNEEVAVVTPEQTIGALAMFAGAY